MACSKPRRCPRRGLVELGLGKLRVVGRGQAFAGVHAKCHFVTRASSGHHFHFSTSFFRTALILNETQRVALTADRENRQQGEVCPDQAG